jgi:UDP-3-O-[3-hydroxymyristoyl] glucosamine N-acyltransferase
LFFRSSKYYTKALNSAATVILINKVDCPEGKALLISEDPFSDFNRLTNHFKPFESANFISTSAIIGQGPYSA